MNNLPFLYREHKEILETIKNIETFLNKESILNETQELINTTGTFSGLIRVHLAREDKNLYPKLLGSKDEKIQSIAKSFQEEMGGIGEVFKKYLVSWNSSDFIKENPEEFIKETEEIFLALKNRIKREENELYPLLE